MRGDEDLENEDALDSAPDGATRSSDLLRRQFQERASNGDCLLCDHPLPLSSRERLDRLCPRCLPLRSATSKEVCRQLSWDPRAPIQPPMTAKNSYWIVHLVMGESYALISNLSKYNAKKREAGGYTRGDA